MADEQNTGMAATMAIIAAIGGIIATFSGHPFVALFVEIAAVVLGVIGFLMAASPRVRGGILSIVAIVVAVFGLGIAVLGMVGVILF
jgi:hypothetical protein